MGNNVLSPTGLTTLLVADTVHTTGGSTDSVATWPKVGGLPVAACAVFQSTSGGVVFPSMTQAQIAALPPAGQALTAGTMIYNSTTGAVNTYNGVAFSAGTSLATGTLTAANIDAMNAAPVLLIPAPAVGFGIFIESLVLDYIRVASFAGGGAISLEYGNAAAAAGPLASATIAAGALTGAVNAMSVAGRASLSAVASTAISGVAVYISNDTAPFTLGVGSTVRYTINYRILPVT